MIAAEYPAVIDLAKGPINLRLGGSVEISHDAKPLRVEVTLRCQRCGALTHAQSEPRFIYCDDDHYGFTELGFEGRAQRDCPECASPIGALWRLTLTRHANGTASLGLEPLAGADSES
jgi:hypothetical protein